MKKIRQWLGKSSKVDSLEDQIQALDGQPPSALEEIILRNSINSSNDVPLKVAAIQRLPYSSAIIHGLKSDEPALEKAARIRLAELIDNNELDISHLKNDIGCTDSLLVAETLLTIAAHSHNHSLQDTILDGISDEKSLAEICVNSHSADVRKLLARRIENTEVLQVLGKTLKNKDKAAYKIIKEKMDQVKAKDATVTEAQQQAAVLCEEIEFHSIHVFDRFYASRLQRLLQRWTDIETIKGAISDSDRQCFTAAKVICEARIKKEEEKYQLELEHRQKLSTADNDRQSLLDKLWLLINQVYELDTIDSSLAAGIREEKQGLINQWEELIQYGTASKKQLNYYILLCETLENLLSLCLEVDAVSQCHSRIKAAASEEVVDNQDLQLLRQSLALIENITEFTAGEQLVNYRETLTNFDKKSQEKSEFEVKQSRIILGLIGQSHQAVEQGKVKKALAIRSSIDDKLSMLSSPPDKLTAQLENLDKAIQKLLDWQAYAETPKKEALITAMQELVGVVLPPEALAIKIKKLQTDWQNLSRSSMGQDENLWEQFSQLADEAYQPCKIYYQHLAAERQNNFKKRQMVVQQLKDYLRDNDWDNANWKKVEKVLQTAKKEFYSYTPIERKLNREVLDEFKEVLHIIQQKLDDEHSSNMKIKNQLIQQAETLVDNGDIEQAISDAKRLQSLWKKSGYCAYKDDQKLWRKFNKHCNDIFAKKASLAAEQEADKQKNLTAAQAVITKVEAYLKLSGEEFLAIRNVCRDDKDEFAKVGELPNSAKNKTHREFSKIIAQFEKKLTTVQREIDNKSWQYFFSLLEKINDRQYQAISSLQNNADKDSLSKAELVLGNDILLEIDEQKRWPEGGREALNNKIALALDKNKIDIQANLEQLRLLCIRIEIASDIESPGSDRELRMEYRMNLLQQGLGHTRQVNTTAETMGIEWAAVGPVNADSYQNLFQRFYKGWKKMRGF